jgi:hypothetical protein
MGITACGESVQPLQSVKLVYQSCSRSRVALGPLWNRRTFVTNLFMLTLFMVHDHVVIWGLR